MTPDLMRITCLPNRNDWKAVALGFASLLALNSACSTASIKDSSGVPVERDKNKTQSDSLSSSNSEEFNGGVVVVDPSSETLEGQESATSVSRTVRLVIGPGWFRAWFAAGFLMELSESRIDISHIAASEMSALIAALYSLDPRPDQFAWNLQSLQQSCLDPSSRSRLRSLFRQPLLDADCLRGELAKKLGDRKLEESSPPLAFAVPSLERRNFVASAPEIQWQSKGKAAELVMQGLQFPGLFELTRPDKDGQPPCATLCSDGRDIYSTPDSGEPGKGVLLILNFSGRATAPAHSDEIESEYLAMLDAQAEQGSKNGPEGKSMIKPFAEEARAFDRARTNDYVYLGRKAAKRWVAENAGQLGPDSKGW